MVSFLYSCGHGGGGQASGAPDWPAGAGIGSPTRPGFRTVIREENPLSSNSEPRRKVEALRERIAALPAAILRISASLDVDTVLREIAEAARALTGARYAVMGSVPELADLPVVFISATAATRPSPKP